MSSRLQVWVIAAVLSLTGITIAIYKHNRYGFPFFPGETSEIWLIEAEVTFTANGDPARVSLALPASDPRFELLNESFSSLGFSFTREQDNGQNRAVWTHPGVIGAQKLFYRQQIQRVTSIPDKPPIHEPEPGPSPYMAESRLQEAQALLDLVRG